MGERIGFGYGGMLTFWEEGARVFFRAELPPERNFIYKIWIAGRTGHELLLGTPMPEGNGLRLFRTMSVSQLRAAGCWPVTGVRAVRSPVQQRQDGGWYRESHPERMLPLLKEKQGIGEVLCCRDRGGLRLAAPLDDRPVPLADLFCFACPRKIWGRWHLVWCFDEKGMPIFPGSEGKNSDES